MYEIAKPISGKNRNYIINLSFCRVCPERSKGYNCPWKQLLQFPNRILFTILKKKCYLYWYCDNNNNNNNNNNYNNVCKYFYLDVTMIIIITTTIIIVIIITITYLSQLSL